MRYNLPPFTPFLARPHTSGSLNCFSAQVASIGQRCRFLLAVTAALAVFGIGSGMARAQTFDDPRLFLNYAYATWLGTGYYTIDEREVWIFRIPFNSYTLREPADKKIGYRLLLPLSFGFHNFNEIPDSLATVTFVPGLEVSIPITKNWFLKPFGQIGYGKDFSGGQGAWIFGGGVRSLALFPWKKWEFGLGNTLMGAAQKFSGSDFDNGFSMFEIGLNVANPWRFPLAGRQTRLDTFFIYTSFIDDLDFFFVDKPREEVGELFQVGLTLQPDRAYRIWFFEFTGAGISYVFGDGVRAIRLHTGFPF